MMTIAADTISFPREALLTATVGGFNPQAVEAAQHILQGIASDMGRGMERLAQSLGELPKLNFSDDKATGAPNIAAGIAQAIETYTGR